MGSCTSIDSIVQVRKTKVNLKDYLFVYRRIYSRLRILRIPSSLCSVFKRTLTCNDTKYLPSLQDKPR